MDDLLTFSVRTSDCVSSDLSLKLVKLESMAFAMFTPTSFSIKCVPWKHKKNKYEKKEWIT